MAETTFEEDDFKSVCNENLSNNDTPNEECGASSIDNKVEEVVVETNDAPEPVTPPPPPPKLKRAPRTSKKPIITKDDIINEAKQELSKEVENKKKEE